MKSMLTICLLVILVGCSRSRTIEEISRTSISDEDSLPLQQPAAEDWPWWRGPAGDGKSVDHDVPISWGPTKNVVWKTAVPGRGHSSPILWGDQIFLTTAKEAPQQQIILGYDRDSGKEVWMTVVHQGDFMRMHPENSPASPTPACDGQHVYTAFINSKKLHVSAIDLTGRIVWQTEAGPFDSEHGYGASPVLYESLVIVNGDNPGSGFLAALNRKTGQIVWRTARANVGNYATPIVGVVAGRPQLLLSGAHKVHSYDPRTGKLIWSCQGPAKVCANTMAFSGELVFASGGYPEKEIFCIRADGSGEVTSTHILWRSKKGVTYVPSPLVHEDRLYIVSREGIATCRQAETGKEIWTGRLPGNFSASPVLAGKHLFISTMEGKTYVFEAGPKFIIVAQSDLGEGFFASPVICGRRIYLRSLHHLYCIGKPEVQREAVSF